MLIAAPNVRFHLYLEPTDLSTVVIVLDKTNHKTQETTHIPGMTEVQDPLTVNHLVKMTLDLKDQKMTSF